MNKLIAILTATACVVANTTAAATYSTEATITKQKDKGTYQVDVCVSQLIERDGKLTEQVISRPKITSAPGVPASLYCGLQPSQPNYKNEENIHVEVSWPEAGKSSFAICNIIVKRGDNVVSKSRLKVQVD
jgi:hypothetical protein